jgi:hypothetical protein
MIQVSFEQPVELMGRWRSYKSTHSSSVDIHINSKGEQVNRFAFHRLAGSIEAILRALEVINCTANLAVSIDQKIAANGTIQAWDHDSLLIAEDAVEEIEYLLQSIKDLTLTTRELTLSYSLTRIITEVVSC